MNLTYAILEIKRTFRNRRYFIFSLIMPIGLLFAFGGQSGKIGGFDAGAFYMVGTATFGAMGAIFNRGGSVSLDRSIGWNRQLRLTALTGRQYVVGKLLTGLIIALPTVVLIFVLSATFHHVHLSAAHWIEACLAIIVTLIPLGVLGVAIGYLAKPDSMQAVGGGVYVLVSFLGGIWFPISQMPGWMQGIAKALPMNWSGQAGRDVLTGSWIGWHGVIVLVLWTIALGMLAAWGYRRDTLRV
jgi:ABC-2 type transport system permease protein